MPAREQTDQPPSPPARRRIVVAWALLVSVIVFAVSLFFAESHPYAGTIALVLFSFWAAAALFVAGRLVSVVLSYNDDAADAERQDRCAACGESAKGSDFAFYYGKVAGGATYSGGGGTVRETRYRILGTSSEFFCAECSHTARIKRRWLALAMLIPGLIMLAVFAPLAIGMTDDFSFVYLGGALLGFLTTLFSAIALWETWTRGFVETMAYRVNHDRLVSQYGTSVHSFTTAQYRRMARR